MVDHIDHLQDTLIYQRPATRSPYWETEILQKAKTPEYVKSEEINANLDGYILCFSSWDVPNFLDINPNRGIYIYSSTGAFKTEQEFDFVRLNQWLNFSEVKGQGIKPKGFRIAKEGTEEKPVFIPGFHASGHASGDEL